MVNVFYRKMWISGQMSEKIRICSLKKIVSELHERSHTLRLVDHAGHDALFSVITQKKLLDNIIDRNSHKVKVEHCKKYFENFDSMMKA